MRFQYILPRFFFYPVLWLAFIFAFDSPFLSAQQVHALWGFTLEQPFGGSPQHTIAALKDNAINAVFVDRLDPAMIKPLHASGIKVFSTVQVFGDHSLWKTYPQLRPVNREGELASAKYGSGICPTQRWYWPTILQKISRKAGAGYDGVWLDFIRFGSSWEEPSPRLQQFCFCDSTLADFAKVTGIAIPEQVAEVDSLAANLQNHHSENADTIRTRPMTTAEKAEWILLNHSPEWTKYKTGVITDFVKLAKEEIAKRPEKLLGIFSVPWRRNEFGEAIVTIIGQDYAALRDHVDVFSPMLYHELCGRPLTWIGSFVKHASNLTKKPVWPIIQTDLGKDHQVTDEEFATAVLNALDPPSKGVIIFRQQTLIDAKQLPTLRAVWR